jgi:hypothetical protein
LASMMVLASEMGCGKTDSAQPPAPSAAASPPAVSMTAPPPSAEPTASAAPEPSSAAPKATTAMKEAPVKKDAATAPVASAEADCGKKPLPDCPLQAWMKSNANPPVMTSDLPKLAAALDKIVGLAPAGYTNWASIAKDGAAAARSGDLAAAKQSCRTCHDQYKQKYKTELRTRPVS